MVLQVVVVQMVHSGGGTLWLEVLLQREIGDCGHRAGSVAVHGGRTHAPAGGCLLACRLATMQRLLHFALHRRVPTTGRRCGFTFISIVLRFGFLLCLLAAFPLHPAILEPDLDLQARVDVSDKNVTVKCTLINEGDFSSLRPISVANTK